MGQLPYTFPGRYEPGFAIESISNIYITPLSFRNLAISNPAIFCTDASFSWICCTIFHALTIAYLEISYSGASALARQRSSISKEIW